MTGVAVASVMAPVLVSGVVGWFSWSDNREASAFWFAWLVLVPCLLGSVCAGLLAALGARIGRRIASSTEPSGAPSDPAATDVRIAACAGAVVGGLVGILPLAGYLAWLYDASGAGFPILLGALGVAFILGAFTWYWSGPKPGTR
ncbi:hypothetical protein ACWKWP_14935 [Agromyces soli]